MQDNACFLFVDDLRAVRALPWVQQCHTFRPQTLQILERRVSAEQVVERSCWKTNLEICATVTMTLTGKAH